MKKTIAFSVLALALLTTNAVLGNGSNAGNSGLNKDDGNLLQYLSERLSDPDFYSYEQDGALEFEDLALLVEEIAEELGIDSSEDISGVEEEVRSGYCSTSGDTISCANSSADKDWIWVGKKASTNDLIICGSTTATGTYYELGSATVSGTTTKMRIQGSSSFAEVIKIARTAGSVTGCSFDAFPSTWFTSLRQIQGGGGYYDYIYGSDGGDTLEGEYVMGYYGDDNISIESDQAGTEYAFGDDDDDYLEGNSGVDYLYGGWGDDEIWSFGGNDVVRGGPDRDTIWGGDGDDYLYGDAEDTGGNWADDIIHGEGGTDHLFGQWGDDILYGEAGVHDSCDAGYSSDDYCETSDSSCDATANCEWYF